MGERAIEILEKSPVKCPKCGEVIAWRTESEVTVRESESYLHLLASVEKRHKIDSSPWSIITDPVALSEEEARKLVEIAKDRRLKEPIIAEKVECLVARALFYERSIEMRRTWDNDC